MIRIVAASIITLTKIASSVGVAQGSPGAADTTRVIAGSYKVDTNHTQVFWTANHMVITPLTGAVQTSSGTLEINPVTPASSKVSVTFNVANVSTTNPAFTAHFSSAEFFDVGISDGHLHFDRRSGQREHRTDQRQPDDQGRDQARHIRRQIVRCRCESDEQEAEPRLQAKTSIKRSDCGLGYALPVVGDQVDLRITAAFEPVGLSSGPSLTRGSS